MSLPQKQNPTQQSKLVQQAETSTTMGFFLPNLVNIKQTCQSIFGFRCINDAMVAEEPVRI